MKDLDKSFVIVPPKEPVEFKYSEYNENYNYAIVASAGTGKTFNIVEIVNKLVQKGIDLSKVLIVTYTEKAAGELKDRIRRNVKNIDINKANIYTIHSFCQSTISEFSLAANRPLDLEVIDEEEVGDFVDEYFRDNVNIKNDIYQIISKFDNIKVSSLRSYVIQTIKKYYLDKDNHVDKDIICIDNKYICFEEFNKANSIEDLYGVIDGLEENYEDLKTGQGKDLEFVSELNNTFKLGFKFDGNTYQARWISKEKRPAFNYFKELKDKYKDLTKIAIGSFVNKHINDIYASWQERKQSLRYQTFNDMIRDVREAVKSASPLKTKLQAKYKYAIIDEFQDTNKLQWDIFKNIFLNDDHRIVVVGDPKQSIYAFQGADLFVYNQAVEEITARKDGIYAILSTNYRSSRKIVQECNKFFSYPNFFLNDIIKFVPSLSLDREKGQNEKIALYDGSESFNALEVIEGDEVSYAKEAVKKIIECLELDQNGRTKLQIDVKDGTGQNVTFKDFAILARTRTELPAIIRELNRVGIPHISYKDDKLFTGLECAHWIAILEAINAIDFSGQNRKLFKKALFTKFFDYSLDEISDDYFNRDDSSEMELIYKWKDLVALAKWDKLIDAILTDSAIEARMSDASSLQSLSIFTQIGDYCIDYLYEYASLEKLINNLKRKLNNDNEEEESGIIGKGTDYDCVQLMTIHASKGLEFPVVISVAGFKGKNKQSLLSTFHDANSKLRITYVNQDKCYQEADEEWMRLFYVAYTRAKYMLIIPQYHATKDANKLLSLATSSFNESPLSATKTDYDLLKEKVAKILLASSVVDQTSSSDQEKVLKELIKKKKKIASYKHSYVSLSHGEAIEEEIINDTLNTDKEGKPLESGLAIYDTNALSVSGKYLDAAPISQSSDFPKGASIGTTLHEIFEKLDFSLFDINNPEFTSERIIARLKANGFKENTNWVNDILNIVNNTLNASLPVIKGSLKDSSFFSLKEIKANDKVAEKEFNFKYKEDEGIRNYFNGFIDLIFRRGEYYSILDWKSDTLNDKDLLSYKDENDLKGRVDNNYSIQRVLYAYCLVRSLNQFYKESSCEETFNKHFGGVYYVFIRGTIASYTNGVYAQTWASWAELEKSYYHIMNDKLRGGKNA